VLGYVREYNHRLYLRARKGVSSKCFACSRCNRRVDTAKTPAERAEWKRQKEMHLQFVFIERVLLNERELLAEVDSRRMHITMDGWDSMKTVVPNYRDHQPELAGMYKYFLKTKLSGALVEAWKLIMMRTFPWINTGANLACTVMVHALSLYQKDHPIEGLPTAADVLVDGGPENINHTLIGTMGWLVTKDVFQTVSTYRLPVGHTHNRLDQRFQKPSLWFHGEDAHEAATPDEWKRQVYPNTEHQANDQTLNMLPRTKSRIVSDT